MIILDQQEDTLTPLSVIIKHRNIHAPNINLIYSHFDLLEGIEWTTSYALLATS